MKRIAGGNWPRGVFPRRAERPDEGGPGADLTTDTYAAIVPIPDCVLPRQGAVGRKEL